MRLLWWSERVTRPAGEAVGTESCAAVLINDLKPREPLMNIKVAVLHMRSLRPSPPPPLVRLWPMTAGEGRVGGRGPKGGDERVWRGEEEEEEEGREGGMDR